MPRNITEEEVLKGAIDFLEPENITCIKIWASSLIKAFVSETRTSDGWEVELSREPRLTTYRRECREGGQRCVTEYEDDDNQCAIMDTIETTINFPNGDISKTLEHIDILEETYERVSYVVIDGVPSRPKHERGRIGLKEDRD